MAPVPSPLHEVVAVLDRLVSPGGCPWDAEQTHESLLRYLVEETYEVVDAVEARSADNGDADLAEELGDLLLQVLFHSRLAAGRGAFDIQDVAAGLRDKLVRRHPHVFGDGAAEDGAAEDGAAEARDVQERWDVLKDREKPARGPVDGIPKHLPALARADKLLARLQRAGLEPVDVDPGADLGVGAELFDAVSRARALGVDPEAALRRHTRLVEISARHAGRHPE